MRTTLAAMLAALMLLTAACATEEDGGSPVSPTVTFDFGSPTATGTTDASPTEAAMASPTESPGEAFGESPDESPTASPTEDDDDGFGASPTASPTDDGTGGIGAATCDEAFEDVPDLTRIDSLRQLQELTDALDATIEACDSVDEWVTEAEARLDLANLDLDARSFLESRCEDSETLSDTDLCQEL